MPVALAINNTRANIPNIMITNSGSMRFDVYAGPFTKNDQLTASPFDDSFLFIPNVPFSVANQVLPSLNQQGANERRAMLEERERAEYGRGYVENVYRRWLQEMDRRNDGMARRAAANLTLGYVTSDVSKVTRRILSGHIIDLYSGLPRCWRRYPPCPSPLLRQPGFHWLYPTHRGYSRHPD